MRISSIIIAAASGSVLVTADGLRKSCDQFRYPNSCSKHSDRCVWPDPMVEQYGCSDITCDLIDKKGLCKKNRDCVWSSFNAGDDKFGPFCFYDECKHHHTKSECQGNHSCFWKNKNGGVCEHEHSLPRGKWEKCLHHGEHDSHHYTPHNLQSKVIIPDFFNPQAWADQESMQKYTVFLLMNPGETLLTGPELPLVVFGAESANHGPVVTLKHNGHVAFYPAGLDYPDASVTSKRPLPLGEDSFVIATFDLGNLKLKLETYGYASGKKNSVVTVSVPLHEYHLMENMATLAPSGVGTEILAVNGIFFAVDESLKAKDLFCAT